MLAANILTDISLTMMPAMAVTTTVMMKRCIREWESVGCLGRGVPQSLAPNHQHSVMTTLLMGIIMVVMIVMVMVMKKNALLILKNNHND